MTGTSVDTYSDTELEALMADLESDCVERKAAASDGDKIRRSICAFANDLPRNNRPGIILVGVRDDGSCAGLDIDDALLTRLSNIRGEGTILPLPSVLVQKRVLKGCEVAVVSITPSADTPVHYRGRAWIRVGPTVQAASAEDLRVLVERRRSTDLPFDMEAAPGARLEDLDLEYIRVQYLPRAIAPEILEQNTRSPEQQLRSLRLMQDAVPTRAAVLAFGREPLRFLPGAYVQFLRIDGMELTDPILSDKPLAGRLDEVLHRLTELLDLAVSVRVQVTGTAREKRQPDYPPDALRQFAYNAVMHRSYQGTNTPVKIYWYNDRVEISSPGGLYGRVTRDNFGSGDTDYRNPLVAEVMHHLGYAQRFGMGVPTARKALAENGNPRAEFHFEQHLVGVTLRPTP